MHGSGSGLSRTVALVLVAAAAAATAPGAYATTVSFGPDSTGVYRLTIADAQGVSDNVLVQEEETSFLVIDQALFPTLTEATGCRRERTPTNFRCGEGEVPSIIQLLRPDAFLGGGNDRYESVTDNFQTINGGPGADTLLPRGGGGTVNGDDGNDLIGAATPHAAFSLGGWTINGGAGNDTLRIVHHRVRDVVRGGAGTDSVSYLGRPQGVRVNQTVINGDGSGSEGDDIGADVEKLIGTDFSDTLIGGDVDNEIVGALGADIMRSGGGFDRIVAGDDGVPDTTIDCGTQPKASVGFLATLTRDLAVVDLLDPATTGCEFEEEAPKDEHPTVQISRAVRSGRVLSVTLVCRRAAKRTCRGTLALVVGRRTVARTTHRVARGSTRSFRLRLSPALARRAAAGAVAARIEAREKAADGRDKRTRARVRL